MTRALVLFAASCVNDEKDCDFKMFVLNNVQDFLKFELINWS